MDNNNYAQQAQKRGIDIMGLIGLVCSGVGLVMTILGTTLTCACSAGKTFDDESTYAFYYSGLVDYKLSAVFIVTIIGVIIALAGIICSIICMKKNSANTKLSMVSILVAIFAVFYGLIPTFTICGYNCSLENANEDFVQEKNAADKKSDENDDYDDYYNDLNDIYDNIDDYLNGF